MQLAKHIRHLLTQPQPEPEPLIEAICLCGPEQQHIAARLGVSEVAISKWALRRRPLPPARRAQLEALARQAFLSALEETRVFFDARPELYRTASAKRWRDRLTRAGKLLRDAGVKV
jgi:DNA-binding transcriptional regulator YdaS (Cro superfamily)